MPNYQLNLMIINFPNMSPAHDWKPGNICNRKKGFIRSTQKCMSLQFCATSKSCVCEWKLWYI